MARLLIILIPLIFLVTYGPGLVGAQDDGEVQPGRRSGTKAPAANWRGTCSTSAGMHDVSVEIADTQGDHYDPEARAVRLSDGNYHGRSLTAVTVAAHEVGHAVQHAEGYAPLQTARGELVRWAAERATPGRIPDAGDPGDHHHHKAPGAGGFCSCWPVCCRWGWPQSSTW
jgi:uncharacterized protein